MKQHLLDPAGLLTLPKGYRHIQSEVDFLKAATTDSLLLISGDHLCRWAEAFFRGRGISFRYARPLADELCDVCPALTPAQAQEIVALLGTDAGERLESPLVLEEILQAIYPMDLWQRTASSQHVAEWLLWVHVTNPPTYVQPLLMQKGTSWEERLNRHEAEFYLCVGRDEAAAAIESWSLNAAEAGYSVNFPGDIPKEIQDRILKGWMSQIVKTEGEFFATVETRDPPYVLRDKAASYTADFYEQNQAAVTEERLQVLSRYLSSDQIRRLRDILPPVEPEVMPVDPQGVLNWFRNSYFPYREWQSSRRSQDRAAGNDIEAARQFALWYLEAYPAALIGQGAASHLAMNRMVGLSKEAEAVTLVAVMDGLHFGDARNFMQKLGNLVPRLSLASDDLVFAALPTITQFCKKALFSGTQPRHADEVGEIGRVIGDRSDPARALRSGVPGDIFLWRIAEPDKTYHGQNSADMLSNEVDGSLGTVAQKIRRVVEAVPDDVFLQVVITTDHGRMLGRSVREMAVPQGMEGHGRAAWGDCMKTFEQAHIIDGEVAYLHGYSFGLPTDAAIVLDESAFQTNDQRGGSELFAHGGLFPEEVIVPWISYARDAVAPLVELSISGTGIARQKGELEISLVNMDQQTVVISQLRFELPSGGRGVVVEFECGPKSSEVFTLPFEPWFSADEAESVSAEVQVRLRNGLAFDIDAEISIESEDMYRRDNILEDLI